MKSGGSGVENGGFGAVFAKLATLNNIKQQTRTIKQHFTCYNGIIKKVKGGKQAFCLGKEVMMSPRHKGGISSDLSKALASKVTDSVKEEIAQVLNVNTDRMTAGQAIAYAQVAKAIKGDKNAFEAIASATREEIATDGSFTVEIKVVE